MGNGPHFTNIDCPYDGECNLYSHDNEFAFVQNTINAKHANKLYIDVDNGSEAFSDTNIYCPIESENTCIINIHDIANNDSHTNSQNILQDVNIYSIWSWNGISIYCQNEDNINCGDIRMYCTKFYNHSCMNGDNEYNSCNDNNSICNIFDGFDSIISSTLVTMDTTKKEMDVSKRHKALDLVIFCIWMGAFLCMAVMIIILYIRYLKQKKQSMTRTSHTLSTTFVELNSRDTVSINSFKR